MITKWFELLVAWACRKLDIARVHELERLEERLEGGWNEMAGDIGQLEELTGKHESRIYELADSLQNAERNIEDLQTTDRDLGESVEHHTGQIGDLDKGVEDLNEFRDNFDREVDLVEVSSAIQNIKQWIDETNETLEAVQKLVKFHDEVEKGGWMKVMTDWRDRLKKLEKFHAEMLRIFRLPESK